MANDNKSGGIKKKAAAAASQKQTQKKEKRSLKEYLKGVRLENTWRCCNIYTLIIFLYW